MKITDDRAILRSIAHRVMLERGLIPDFPHQALAELEQIRGPAVQEKGLPGGRPPIRSLQQLPWCSIDNDDSRDLDQLTVAESLPAGEIRIQVAIADVDALVRKESALDDHARGNTTSVYTMAQTFPLLPEKLSTDLTSLAIGADRLAVVIDMVFAADGSLRNSDIQSAMVHNHAKLAYHRVAAWLENTEPRPPTIGTVDGLDANLRLQDHLAQQLKAIRHAHGALDLDIIEAHPVFAGETLRGLETDPQNRANELIAEFMIAANGVVARYLADHGFPTLRRIVRTPQHWDRIVELAADHGTTLPITPDPLALEHFLIAARAADPLRFPDLSLSVIKLLGRGEYVAQFPGDAAIGHFGLAVADYAHSTAPNRRFPDLITQRLIKAVLANQTSPYGNDELHGLAMHCTAQEDAAKKVERLVRKSAAALLLATRIGDQFDAIVTGASDAGTWVRIMQPPIEGKLERGASSMRVGQRLRVQLIRTDVARGFIDFQTIVSHERFTAQTGRTRS